MSTPLVNDMAFPLCVLFVMGTIVSSLQDHLALQVPSLQDQSAREVDRRLLLNDPQTILVQLEAMQREMQTLKTLVNTQQTKIQSMQTLETSVNTQQTKVQSMDTLVNTQQTKIQTLDTLINSQQSKIQKQETLVNSQQSQIQSLQSQLTKTANQGLGTTYTVWGRKNCPALNGTSTVYSGISAGSPYHIGGGGANTLCLTHNPDQPPSDFPTTEEGHGVLYGSEYQFTYRNYAMNDDVPCAVCLAAYSTAVLMIPSKTSCPIGWNEEYRGFLTSQSATDRRPQYEYLCLHENAEYLTEGARQNNYDGRLFYPVITHCGSLPCPPYINAKHVTCVVCSK
ncbi:uncharacterized protein LOC130049234 [Ostrea edulis]|uniref:uncharacterized protein LOC130049234 n=1 Tax=Ostrea edulis TaxID=37623 RepID=UPI0024AEAAFA|nr:uncharacterized protein LOC130049234 [Ostrea edulis]